MACSSVSSAKSVLRVLEARQPTIICEYTSMTNATYTNPDQVAT